MDMFLRNFFFKQLEYVPSYFEARRDMWFLPIVVSSSLVGLVLLRF